KPINPVILIFDNELNIKNKPLKKFANSLSEAKKMDLEKNLYINVVENTNLYLVTYKIIDSQKNYTEIEDLLDKSIISTGINDKNFSNKSKIDPEKEFGKKI